MPGDEKSRHKRAGICNQIPYEVKISVEKLCNGVRWFGIPQTLLSGGGSAGGMVPDPLHGEVRKVAADGVHARGAEEGGMQCIHGGAVLR
jgi:hypothetical protein